MSETINKYQIGFKHETIFDNAQQISFPTLVFYPSFEQTEMVKFGPYQMNAKKEASIADGKFPLVLISHGNGGSHLLYREITSELVKNGYIVALPEHYGNNRNNNSLEYTLQNLINRPAHISLTIDKLVFEPFYKPHIDKNKIAFIGHSMGGYTGLALAGGIPRTKEGEIILVQADKRIKAIVLMAPGAGWFKYGLQKVTIPILLFMAEHDEITPLWNADIIQEGIEDASKVSMRIIENAGHFSFLSPFPENMKIPGFLPAIDPTGFDRVKFHQEFPLIICDFLNTKLL